MKIVLAGAGTAGHIEPALAVADEWRKEFPQCEFEFVGTTSGLENILVTGAGYKLTTIPKVTLPRSLNPAGLVAPIRFGQALTKSLQIVNGAECVIGFGGYVSAPIYLAAAAHRWGRSKVCGMHTHVQVGVQVGSSGSPQAARAVLLSAFAICQNSPILLCSSDAAVDTWSS